MYEDEPVKFNFGQALEFLKGGTRVQRRGWNGKGMWLALIRGWSLPEENPLYEVIEELETLSWIGMKTAQDQFVPWLASQADLLAEDWVIAREV